MRSNTPTGTPSGLVAALSPIVFGLFAATCLPLLASPLGRALSPFASTVVAFAAAAALLVPTSLPALLRDSRPSNRTFVRSALAGVLLMLSLCFVVLGVREGASLLGATLFLSLVPSLSLLGRKLLWGETLATRQQAGLLVSLLAASVWLAMGQETGVSARHLRYLSAVGEGAFSGNALVFLGATLMGLALAAGRPSELRVSLSTWWFYTVGFAFLLSLPLMFAAHLVLEGPAVPFAGVGATVLRSVPEILLPAAALGVSQLFLRLRLLGGSSARLSVGSSTLLSTAALLLAGSLLAGLQGEEGISLFHFVMLPLHLVGLCLGRDALVPWAPYAGPREARPPAAREKVA